jgi:hypothetical protein
MCNVVAAKPEVREDLGKRCGTAIVVVVVVLVKLSTVVVAVAMMNAITGTVTNVGSLTIASTLYINALKRVFDATT